MQATEEFGALASEAAGLQGALASTFLTEVPRQGEQGFGDVSPELDTGRGGSAQPRAPVLLAEKQALPAFSEERPTPLPGKVPAQDILTAAASTVVCEDERTQRWWQQTFLKEESVEVVQDVFWWFFCQKFKPNEDTKVIQGSFFPSNVV
jgi:hypothetical protein